MFESLILIPQQNFEAMRIYKIMVFPFLALYFFYPFLPNATSQQMATQKSGKLTVFEMLSRDEGAKMTLEADLTTISANRRGNDYFPSDGLQFKVDVRPRGKYRRKIAEIPPLKIKFKKKALTAAGLDTLNEVKLVLPCYDSEMGDELIIREYLAYRMFEEVAGVSVRARLIRLNLRDTHVEKSSKRSVMAILVEDEEETCARLNAELVENFGTPTDSLAANQAALVVMFQYMIGNTDWDISLNRNVRLLRSPVTRKITVVPYDFDFSGLVGAPYASPSSETGLKTVRDRFLMSHGLRLESLRRATQVLKAARKDLLAICQSKYLSNEASDDLVMYLESFFRHVENRDEVSATLLMPPMD